MKQKKLKYIQINTVCNWSTGRIMWDIQRKANELWFDTLSIYGRRKWFKDLRCIKVWWFFSFWFHVILTTIFDKQWYWSYLHTKKIVKILREENPDVIHLHNIHWYYLNYPVLFKYLSEEYKGKVLWTFHDCWPFTWHCPYFTMAKCNKRKTWCYKCLNKWLYPISLIFDNSRSNYESKKKYFTSLKNLTIITPSDWLNNLVKQSFMWKYDVITVNNRIDRSIFKPNIDKSVLKKYNIPNDKKIILWVANIWEERKWLKVFKEMARKIDDSYLIVLVWLNDKQIKELPSNIIWIKRTSNIDELVTLYTRSNVFVNPSQEETFSLVTIEAMACKTKVVVLDTSAVWELVDDETGIVLHNQDIQNYIKAIYKLSDNKIRDEKLTKILNKYDKDKQITKIINLIYNPGI